MERIANILIGAALIGIVLPFVTFYLFSETSSFIHSISWFSFVAVTGGLGVILFVATGLRKKQRLTPTTALLLLTLFGFILGALAHSMGSKYGKFAMGAGLFFLILWFILPTSAKKESNS